MSTLAGRLGLTVPLIGAPMAGGPGGTRLALAVARAGGMGFLAGGYKTPESFDDEIRAMIEASVPFGVNLFAPRPARVTPADFRAYAARIAPDLRHYHVARPANRSRTTTAGPRRSTSCARGRHRW